MGRAQDQNAVANILYGKKRELYGAFRVCAGKTCHDLLRTPITLETLPRMAVICGFQDKFS